MNKAELVARGLTGPGFAVLPDFVTAPFVAALAQESLALHATGGFRPAGIGRGPTWDLRPDLRSDDVLWVDPLVPTRHQRRLLRVMERLRVELNRTLFLGLHTYEAHLALYRAGTFYTRHRDAHVDSFARRVTTTLYLNSDWNIGDGGHIALYPEDEAPILVPPRGGTLIAFLSQELEHEVMPAQRSRLSWTGWYRRAS